MAKFFPALFLVTLFISTRVQARESQFFSKFTTTANANIKAKEQENSLKKQEQDQPAFFPDTQNGYGLYGHESGQLPPSKTAATTTTSAVATKTSFADEPYYNGIKNYNGVKNSNLFSQDSFTAQDEQSRDTQAMLQGSSYTTKAAVANNYENTAANGQNNYFAGTNTYSSNGNLQKQGMSDTRFLENGKYYFNVDDEEKYNPNRFTNAGNARYNSQGYFGGNNANSYSSNGNRNYYSDSYANWNAKAMAAGYQQENNQYEFQGSQNQEFIP